MKCIAGWLLARPGWAGRVQKIAAVFESDTARKGEVPKAAA